MHEQFLEKILRDAIVEGEALMYQELIDYLRVLQQVFPNDDPKVLHDEMIKMFAVIMEENSRN